jgi:hypothetical protein
VIHSLGAIPLTDQSGPAVRSPTPAAFPPQSAAVRRTDVVLRSIYPQLQTRIFQIAPFAYRIVFDEAVLRADVISGEFESKIRPVTVPVQISNDLPENFLREIPPIRDHEIASGFAGFPFSRDDLRTVLYGKFPGLPNLASIDNLKHPTLTLSFERELTAEEKASVSKFFERWESGWPIEIAVGAPKPDLPTPPVAIGADMLRIKSARRRSNVPPFVQEDEAYWFDNVEAIFGGGISPGRVLDVESLGMSCYVDATVFPQIDVRQALICYDTVFMSPPLIDGGGQSFWLRQGLKRDDFIELAGAGKVRFVLRQPEERTDLAFLTAVYNANPAAIIGRRKASALLAADLVQTADEYRFNMDGIQSHIPELAQRLASELQVPEAEIIQLLLWPNSARRSCLLPLMTNGLMSLGAFGQGKLLGDQLQRVTGRDVRLEALATSDGVHIAHTLNATLIPPLEEMEGWIVPRRMVGDRLNFYRSFNTRITAAWADNERRREEKVRLLPPIPIFEFDRHAKVRDLIRTTSYQSTRRKGRALLARLSELPVEERQAEIDRLSGELYELGTRKEKRMMYLDTADNVKEVGAHLMELTLFPVRSVWNLVQAVLRVGRRIPALDNFMDDLQEDLTPLHQSNSDLDFLSKIERVAQLRTPDISR